MRRRLVALLVCLTACAAWLPHAPAVPGVPLRIAAASVPAESAADTPRGAGDADRQWVAASRLGVAGTETNWTTTLASAALRTPSTHDDGNRSIVVRRPDGPNLHRSPHLRHVPLLI